MSWAVRAEGPGSLVTIRAEDVPPGISAADHRAGMTSSLAALAALIEQRVRSE